MEKTATNRFRIGLVGAGMVASHHIAGWREQKQAKIIAVADPDKDAAQARASQCGQAQAFPDLSTMLAQETLDAVDIVAPVAHHAHLIEQACAHGLPVMCQKPLTPTASEAQKLADALPPHARVMVHENWRWRAPYRALKLALDGGHIPRPTRFAFSVVSSGLLPDMQGQRPALARQPFLAELERLIVFELLIHHLDTLHFLFGSIDLEKVELSHRANCTRGEDTASLWLRAGGIEGTLTGSFAQPGAPPLPVDTLLLDDGKTARVDGWSLQLPSDPIQHWDPVDAYQASYTDTIAHFLQATRSGSAYETGLHEATYALNLVEHIYQMAGEPNPRPAT